MSAKTNIFQSKKSRVGTSKTLNIKILNSNINVGFVSVRIRVLLKIFQVKSFREIIFKIIIDALETKIQPVKF